MKNDIGSGENLLSKKNTPVIVTLYVTIFILLAMIAVFYFLAIVPIDGDSMENTIHDGQYCIVQKKCFDVTRGDIVTVNTENPGSKEHILIKRIIGTSGDKLVFMTSADGNYVDIYICRPGENYFTYLNEPYIKERMLAPTKNPNKVFSHVSVLGYTNELTELTATKITNSINYSRYVISVPKNSIFFLGDNRNTSRDSRYYGTRTLDHITGKVLCIL